MTNVKLVDDSGYELDYPKDFPLSEHWDNPDLPQLVVTFTKEDTRTILAAIESSYRHLHETGGEVNLKLNVYTSSYFSETYHPVYLTIHVTWMPVCMAYSYTRHHLMVIYRKHCPMNGYPMNVSQQSTPTTSIGTQRIVTLSSNAEQPLALARG